MKKEISQPTIIAAIAVVVLFVAVLGWFIVNRETAPITPREQAQAGKLGETGKSGARATQRGSDVP